MVKIKIYYVDGSYNEFEENELILKDLEELEKYGYTGKALLDKLITDDWGVPPSSITFIYNSIEKTISYH
jgi:hypothetical protein